MIKKGIAKIFLGEVLVVLMLLFWSQNALAQLSGAIFTTDMDGRFVNGNVYDAKEDVYLNGGPRPNKPCGAPGLPDGQYYFQVTDPSGSVLLSMDDVENRKVVVTDGMITESGGDHAWGYGTCGDITVQLYPYDMTPNPGGEYKVWMTLVSDYELYEDFLPKKSKTDNFKVEGSPGGGGSGGGGGDGEGDCSTGGFDCPA